LTHEAINNLHLYLNNRDFLCIEKPEENSTI